MWTEERIEALKTLWNAGVTAEKIAEQIGVSGKNSVIGKARRIGLGVHELARGRVVASPRAAKRARASVRKAMLTMAATSPLNKASVQATGSAEAWIEKHLSAPPKPAPVIERPLPASVVATKSFDDLERDDCKFPVGEVGKLNFGFCGASQAPGRPYCIRCCQIAFEPPKVRRRSLEAA